MLEEELPGVSTFYKRSLLDDRDFQRNHFRKMNQIRVSSINESIISTQVTKDEILYKEISAPSNDKVSTGADSSDIPPKQNSPK